MVTPTMKSPSLLVLCALCLTLPLLTLASSPTYTIIAPAKLRPNSEYHVSLQLANASKPVYFEVELAGAISASRVVKFITVNPSETTVQKLDVGDWPQDNYKLTVKGISEELNFKKETEIGYEAKSYSVFVQTDKAMYKPGQAVKFRAIIVNPALVPSVSGTVDVYIKVSESWFIAKAINQY